MSAPPSPSKPMGQARVITRPLLFVLGVAIIGIWLINTPGGLMGKADAIGYAVCHRIDLRSFHLGTRALPLCSRCSGMYLGALGAFLFYFLRRPRAGLYPSRRVSLALGLFALIWLIDGLNSFAHFFPEAPHLYPPNNTLRLITGTLFGVSLATMIYPVFSQSIWREWRRERVLRSGVDLVLILAIAALIVGAVLTENPFILYPLALISSLGVLTVLTIAYTILILSFTKKLNHVSSWREVVPTAAAGWVVAMMQIGAIDLARYMLTGTWDGFHF